MYPLIHVFVVEALLTGKPDNHELDAPATIPSDMDNLEHSLAKLRDMIDSVLGYVNDVVVCDMIRRV